MDVDPYRFAYNVFHRNWGKFGIPSDEIPLPKTDKVPSLDFLVPSFSNTVALFQIASRKELKEFLDNECQTAHNVSDIYTRFTNIMEEAFPMLSITKDNLRKRVFENTASEKVSQDTKVFSECSMQTDSSESIEKYPHNDALQEDLQEVLVEEDVLEDSLKGAMNEGLLKDVKKEDLSGNSKKESPSGSIPYEDIPGVIAYSLAVCAELVLYKRENENNKDHMKSMPTMWSKFFNECLKPCCTEAGCTQRELIAYSENIKCPEKFLNKFIAENKNEDIDIADKFLDYTQKHYADGSPEHIMLITKCRSFSKGISFLKMRETFRKLKQVCNCVKSLDIEEMPLISPASSSSTPSA